jgi:phage FluMu gp28-like protein
LRGNPIVLDNGATLYFLSTNARTAQSYHGNLYFDEYFWVQKFPELNKVASGMAMHKQWRKTYFSTPSTIAHGAYPFWTGEAWGKGRKDKTIIDVSHGALKSGRLCADGQWRQIITVEDAAVLGCDLFDLAQLKLEYGASEYANLLLCQFVDDTASVFPFALLQRAMVDSWDAWQTDFSPLILRPFGNREVWIGYDPAHSGDCSGLAVVAPPLTASGKFRVLEKAQFKGLDFEAQAKAIRNLCARYNVAYIGIDATGVGQGVLQLVRSFYPSVTEIRYSQDSKTRMVLKGLDTFAKGRIEFDAGWADMAQSFMAIRQTSTDSGRGMTFKASRSAEISHADLAWAVLHALANEPLEGQTQTNGGFLEIFD